MNAHASHGRPALLAPCNRMTLAHACEERPSEVFDCACVSNTLVKEIVFSVTVGAWYDEHRQSVTFFTLKVHDLKYKNTTA